MLAFFYSLALLVSLQVREPVWPGTAGNEQSAFTVQSIHLLPLQDQQAKNICHSVCLFPLTLFQIASSFKHQSLQWLSACHPGGASGSGLASALGSVNILLPVLRL